MGRHSARRVSDMRTTERLEGVHIGKIVEIDANGVVRVDFKQNTKGPLPAKLSGAMQERLEKRGWSPFTQVLLMFEDADPSRPVVVDSVVGAVGPPRSQEEIPFQFDEKRDVTIDGRTLTFDAREQIVLKCGKSSITLTKAGKVIIRGAYLLNRSSGVNKIKGGSVQIN